MINSASRDSPVNRCSECGCPCENCIIRSEDGFAYQQEEIEKLRSLARCQQVSINRLESELDSESSQRCREQQKFQDELARLRDRYDRLLDSHKKLSRLNSGLEERLLTMAERLQSGEAELGEQQRRLALSEAERKAARDEADRLLRDASWCLAAAGLSQAPLPPSQPQPPVASVSVPLPTFPPTFAHVPPAQPAFLQQQQQQQPKAPSPVPPQPSVSVVLHL